MDYYNKNLLSIMPAQNQPIQPDLSSLGMLVNPRVQTPEPKKVFTAALGKKNRGTKAATGGPLAKNKRQEKTEEQRLQDNTDSVVAEVDKMLTPEDKFQSSIEKMLANAGKLPKGGEFSQRTYSNLVPNAEDFTAGIAQGKFAWNEALGGPESVDEDKKMNNALLREALQNYTNKADNPYRNVDLERMDKLFNSAFGTRKTGVTNVAEPTNEFNTLAGAINNIQKDKQLGATQELDYLKTVLRPQLTGEVGAKNTPIRPTGGRTASQAQQADKYVIDTYKGIEKENSATNQKFAQLRGNLKAGTLSAVKSSLPILAKTVGSDVGNIALQEAERYMPKTLDMTFTDLLSYLESDPNAKVPPETVRAIQTYVDVAEKQFKKRASSRLRESYDALSKSPFYADPNARIGGDYIQKAEKEYSSSGGRIQELLNKARKN